MNVFEKRPLSLILSIILGGFFLFAVCGTVFQAILLSLSLIFLLFVIFHPYFRKIKLIKILSILFIISSLLSTIYFNIIFFPGFEEDREYQIEGEIIDIDDNYNSYSTILTVKIDEIDDKSTGITKYNAQIYLTNKSDDIKAGDKVRFYTEINNYNASKNGNSSYYISRGISAFASIDSIEKLEDGTTPFNYRLKLFREDISEYIISITDHESGGLLTALLLGERQYMNEKLSTDFGRIGITHILALSGMHLVMLSFGISIILSLFKVGRNLKTIIVIVFVFLFMTLTGFPYSVVRAGVMLIISSILFLISGSKDNVTSLLLSFTIIIIFEPYAILDVGLLLSVIATFGVLMSVNYYSRVEFPKKLFAKLCHKIKSSLFMSLLAISATYAVLVFFFDTTSALSIIATLLFTPLTEIYAYIGILAIIVGGRLHLDNILEAFFNLISKLSDFMVSVPYMNYSLENPVIQILGIGLTILTFFFFIFKFKNKKLMIMVIAVCYLIVNILGISFSVAVKTNDSIIYEDNSGERILILSDGIATLIDISGHSLSSAYSTTDFLFKNGITEIDNYFALSYSYSLPDMINIMLSRVKIDNFILPMPVSKEEDEIAREIYKTNISYDVFMEFYKNGENIQLGKDTLIIAAVSYFNDKNKYCAFSLQHNEQLFSYISSGALENNTFIETMLFVSDTVILGTYGVKYDNTYYLNLTSDRLKNVVLNTKNLKVIRINNNVNLYKEKNIKFKC